MYEDDVADDGQVSKLQGALGRKWQHYLDLSAPHTVPRWLLSLCIVLIYALRVYMINGVACAPNSALKPHRFPAPFLTPRGRSAGWYIITYGLGIYVLNLLIGFLSPQADPEIDGPTLPTSRDDEFRPFIRRLPEFKFWYSLTKAFSIAFVLTFFQVRARTASLPPCGLPVGHCSLPRTMPPCPCTRSLAEGGAVDKRPPRHRRCLIFPSSGPYCSCTSWRSLC